MIFILAPFVAALAFVAYALLSDPCDGPRRAEYACEEESHARPTPTAKQDPLRPGDRKSVV